MALPSFRDFMGKKERKARNEYEQTTEGAPVYTPPVLPTSPSPQPLPSFATYMSQQRPVAEPSPVTAAPALQQPPVATVPPAAVPASASAFDRKEIARSAAAVPQPTPSFEPIEPAPPAALFPVSPLAKALGIDPNAPSQIRQANTGDKIDRFIAGIPEKVKQTLLTAGAGIIEATGIDDLMNRTERASIRNQVPVAEMPREYQDFAQRQRDDRTGMATPEGWDKKLNTMTKDISPVTKGAAKFVGNMIVEIPVAMGAASLGGVPFLAQATKVKKLGDWIRGGSTAAKIVASAITGAGTGLTKGVIEEAGRSLVNSDVEAFDALRSLQAVGGSTLDYTLYSALYPGINKGLEKVPFGKLGKLPGAVAEGVVAGGAAGLGVGAMKAGGQFVWDAANGDAKDVSTYLKSIVTESGQEVSEEVVEAIGLAIANALTKGGAGGRRRYSKIEVRQRASETAQQQVSNIQSVRSSASIVPGPNVPAMVELLSRRGFEEVEPGSGLYAKRDQKTGQWDTAQAFELQEQAKTSKASANLVDKYLKDRQDLTTALGISPLEANLARVVTSFGKSLSDIDETQTVQVGDRSIRIGEVIAWTEQVKRSPTDVEISDAELKGKRVPKQVTGDEAIEGVVVGTLPRADGNHTVLIADETGKVVTRQSNFLADRLRSDSSEQDVSEPSGNIPGPVAEEVSFEDKIIAFNGGDLDAAIEDVKGNIERAKKEGLNHIAASFEQSLVELERRRVTQAQTTQTATPSAVEAGQKTGQIDRAQLLRDANPGMDEKAIMDMVKTTGNLSDAEFTAFAGRAGKPEVSPSSTAVAPAVAAPPATTRPTPAPTNAYAGETFTHFTTPEGKAALESGAAFDFGINPQHGTGDLSDGPKTGRFAGNALYLSLNDKRWGTADRDTGVGNVEPATDANKGKGQTFYDYDKQKWMVRIGGSEKVPLQRVSYTLAADAKVLTIDSEESLKKAVHEASIAMGKKVYPMGDDALWEGLAKRYDAIAIRNADKLGAKFFRAASGDQLIVLNQAKATVVKPEVPVQTPQEAPGSQPAPGAPNPSPQTPAPAQQAGGNAPAAVENNQTLAEKARAAFSNDAAFQNFLRNPKGWQILLTKPDSPQGRYWIEKRAADAGNGVSPKIGDLLMEQKSLLGQAQTKTVRDSLARVQKDLEQAIQLAIKPADKTALERVAAGEEAISLTGKPLPPGALEGRVEKPITPEPAPQAPQQGTLFDKPASLSEVDQRRADLETELADVRRDWAEVRTKRDAAIDKLAAKLAKDATAENDRLRKEFWTRIKNTGYIRPYADGYLKEDLLSRVPNHLKRKNGAMNLDSLASAMGYESDEALVKEIEQFERARSVDPRRFAGQAEELADYEHPDLKRLNDYYRQAEQEVLSAIDELESGKDGADQGEAATAGRVEGAAADAGAGAGQVPGDGAGGSKAGPRRGGASQEDALETRSTDKAVDDVQAMAAPGRLLGSTPPTVSKGAVKRLDIVRHFTEGLKVPIRQGRFLQHALGIFKVRQEAIRTKLAEDLRTITHEVGHYLDKRFKLRDAAFDAELLPLGHPTSRPSYTKDQVRAEGVAEFTNLYLTDKTAANQVAPKFFARFERALSGEPKVRKVILAGQDMLHTYVAQNATDMVKSGISYTPPADPITWQVMKQKAFDLYAAWVDKHDPILVAEKALNNGKQLPTRLSPKAQADLSRGWEGLAKTFLEKGAQRWDDATQSFKTVGPSLEAILDPVADKLDDFAAYTAAMRALYLAKTRQNPDGTPWDDHKFPFPLWAARDTVREYSSPEFATALKQLQTFQDAVLDYYGDAEFLTVEQRRQIRKQNLIYVPFLREQMEEGPGMRQALGPKYASLLNAVVKMKGGTGTIINPLHSIIHNTFKLINLAQRNHVAVALANLADVAEGGADIIEDVTKSFRPATFSLEQIKDALEDAGADLDTIDLDAMATVFSPNHMPTAGDAAKGIFGVYRNGQTKFYQTDPELYRALNAMDKPAFNRAIRALSAVTKPKRTFAVLTPEFIARNFGRDVLTAGVYGRGLPLEAHMRGLIAQVFDKEAVTRWEAGGGFHSSTVSVDRDYQKETILNLAHRNAKLLKENLLPPWRALQNLSEIIERSPRIGEMLMAEKGNALERSVGIGPGVVDTPTAILESRDLTLDFGRSGNQGQQLNQITAFFNAAAQDVDKFARMHANPKTAGRIIARGLAFITLPTLLLWLRNKDDEEYKEFPQWRKDLAWNFKIGGRWYWYPAPHTLALVYKTMPERILNAIYQENPKALTKGLGETVSSAAVPNLVPDALALLAELKFNWNLFGDRPIVPRGEEAKEAAQQAGPYTTETAKRIGAAINVAPRKVDHAVQGVLASGGRYALAASDKALEVVGRATGAPVPPAKSERESAFVRAFSSENPLSSGAESINDFYDLKQRHDTLWASLPGRVGVDKPLGEYANFTTAERDALATAVRTLSKSEQELIGGDFQRWRTITKKALNKAEDQLSTYSKAKRAVEASKLMSAEQKRKEIDRIDRLRSDLARKTLGKPPL